MGLFEVESHAKEVKDLSDAAVDRIIETWGLMGEGFAVEEVDKLVYDTPESPNYIRTGDLRKSIDHRTESEGSEKYAVIGSDMEYAPYVELGTKHMKKRPFIRYAIEKHKDEYADVLKEELQNA